MNILLSFRFSLLYRYFILLILSAPLPLYAKTCGNQVEFTGFRGINMTLHRNHSSSDFAKISNWGADHVRLVINADPLTPRNDGFYLTDEITIDKSSFSRLDQAILYAQQYGIKVVIALNTFPGRRSGKIWSDYNYWHRLEGFWKYIANRYKNNTTIVGYSLMDEPNLIIKTMPVSYRRSLRNGDWHFPAEWRNTPKDYFLLMEKISKTINAIDIKKSIIISGVGLWGHPVNFKWMEPINACNVVYSFSMFLPHRFTSAGKKGRKIIPYDSRTQRKTIIAAMEPVLSFSKHYKANIYIAGMGLSHFTEKHGAADWLRDVLVHFEENGWNWAYWNYSINFRNPEVIINNGTIERRDDTERLKILKKYWSRN